MKRTKYKILRLTLAVLLMTYLALNCGCRDFIPDKEPVSAYPSLRENFDEDFQQALVTALKNEFRGQYRHAVENKRAAFVVVDISDLQHPKTAGVNADVMLYAASLPKIAIVIVLCFCREP